MRIGIYADVAKEDKPTGIGLHIRRLVDAIARLDQENEYLLYYQRGVLRDSTGLSLCPPQANFRPRPVRFPARWVGDHPRLWWDRWLPRCLRKDRVDVFHGPNHFLPAFDPARSVVTIHDIAYFRLDDAGCQSPMLRTWTRKALDRAAAVIALSENTRTDVESLGVDPGRIQVIYGGANVVPEQEISYARAPALKARLNLPAHYILFVGSLLPRKNVPFLLRSFARLKAANPLLPHKLVLAGHRDKAAEEVDRLCRELGIADDVIITGYVESWELPLLYKLADVFVLPTLYEGFTLVTLESMHYGTPVIATDTSSIREGTGEAALLVPVNDDEALAAALGRVLGEDGLRKQMIERGKVQARKFTWEQCARDTIGVYTQLAQRSRTGPRALAPAV
jgi:glycosyltransferase involved in cell wall biosynthesis